MSRWEVEWLVDTDDGSRRIPAFEFLRRIPKAPRDQLLAILDAVRATGPDQWRDPTSHRPMKGEIDNLHEARDRHGETLYRLFLLWQREERRVIVIDGRRKRNTTTLAGAEYDAVRDLAATVGDNPPPLATANDFARLALNPPASPNP